MLTRYSTIKNACKFLECATVSLKKVRHVELFGTIILPLDIVLGLFFFVFGVVVMSETFFFPLKKFLVVNRGEDVPQAVTVLCTGEREIWVKHANSVEARRELQYQARQLGANSLLNVHVDWIPGDLTRYMAYGTPAVCGRKHRHGSMTADEICTGFNMPAPPRPPQQPPPPPKLEPNVEFWKFLFKFVAYTCLVIALLWFLTRN